MHRLITLITCNFLWRSPRVRPWGVYAPSDGFKLINFSKTTQSAAWMTSPKCMAGDVSPSTASSSSPKWWAREHSENASSRKDLGGRIGESSGINHARGSIALIGSDSKVQRRQVSTTIGCISTSAMPCGAQGKLHKEGVFRGGSW